MEMGHAAIDASAAQCGEEQLEMARAAIEARKLQCMRSARAPSSTGNVGRQIVTVTEAMSGAAPHCR